MNLEYKKARERAYTRFISLSEKIYKWQNNIDSVPENLAIRPEDKINIPDFQNTSFSLSNTRQMKILNLSKQLLKETLQKNKSELLPELNFIFSYKLRNYTFDKGKAFSEFDYNNYTVGLELNYPLGNLKSRGQMKEIKSKLIQWNYNVQNFQRNYNQSYNELVKILNTYINILQFDRDLMEQSKILINEEEKKYHQGRSDLYYIIENKKNLLTYNLAYIQDYIAYKKVQIQLLGLKDILKK